MAVRLGEMKLRHPVILSSGPLSANGEFIRKAIKAGAAAVITRTSNLEPGKSPIPAITSVAAGMLNVAPWWSDLTHEQWIEREMKLAKKDDTPIIASIVSPRKSIDEIRRMASGFARAGADAIQLPLGANKEQAASYVSVAKQAAAGKQVWAKLAIGDRYGIWPSNLADLGKVVEEAGADAIVALDAITGSMKIDLDKREPLLGTVDGLGRISGPAIHPLAVYSVSVLHRSVKIPIIGTGGVMTGEDAMEMVMAGASAVGVCTAAIIEGPKAILRIAREMRRFMRRKRIGSVEEVKGVATKALEDRSRSPPTWKLVSSEELMAMSKSAAKEYASRIKKELRILKG